MTKIAIIGAGLAGSSLTHWLLKSGFDHIQISAVEGFVPDDEDRVTVQRAWESKQEG